MPLVKLHHVNLRTRQIDTMIDWYRDVLGIQQGDRPPSSNPGAWLYLGDTAAVHLVDVKDEAGVGSESDLKLEHFAFSATGLDEFLNKLQTRGITYRRSDRPAMGLVLVNIWDPDGNHIHVDFPFDE